MNMSDRMAVSNINGYDFQKHKLRTSSVAEITLQPETLKKSHAKVPSSTDMSSVAAPQTFRRKNFVFIDPVAFRYIEEDSTTTVIERNGIIQGYELYLVEQWACSRTHPTFVIATYTGDSNHKGVVGVLAIPEDEREWSPRLRLYFSASSQYSARPQETPLGTLMVTNLNSFPSTLNVIHVPDGNVRKHRVGFVVNENLKRLGCSGRSGITLAPPAGATQAKFLQIYKTSQRLPLSHAVIELIKLCQIALILFGKLDQEYADGCLCDMTETAIAQWWTEIGTDHYNVEPTDGVLGPTTIAGLLGMLMGARNRLSYCGAPVGKDAFDVYNLKRGIEGFQKSHKLKRTRRLDRHTLDRLHKVTAKAAAGEGWVVPKAVKSTVVELSGKGGEMVMGIVGRDKAGIGDIETLDIDNFIGLASSERTKWLWHGKSRRTGAADNLGKFDESQGFSFTRDDQAISMLSHGKSDIGLTEDESERLAEDKVPGAVYSRHPPGSNTSIPESPSDRDHLHKAVLKSVTEKMSDAKTGLVRIKDAVGRRGYANRLSKDEGIPVGSTYNLSPTSNPSLSPSLAAKAFNLKDTPSHYQTGVSKRREPPSVVLQGENLNPGSPKPPLNIVPPILHDLPRSIDPEKKWAVESKEVRQTDSNNENFVAGICYESEPDEEHSSATFEFFLRRRHSVTGGVDTLLKNQNENRWPRHMSFSEAEDALFEWKPILAHTKSENGNKISLGNIERVSEGLNHLLSIQNDVKPWVESKLETYINIDQQLFSDQDVLQTTYNRLMDQFQTISQKSEEILGYERKKVADAIKEVEILGAKLDYEINALVSKVDDVEDGVIQFERKVFDLEIKAEETGLQLRSESWTSWIFRNIKRALTVPDVAMSSLT
ncbi:BgTH12-00743 [Blumeria graminis f. sp. triticale]|nr:BgTH12-00743 [Blumeria graminis f. sp. triticale]